MITTVGNNLAARLEALFPAAGKLRSVSAVGGGSIADSYRVHFADGSEYFVKCQARPLPGAFASEFAALAALQRFAGDDLRIPAPLVHEEDLLVMEVFTPGRPGPDWQVRMGRGLACLHEFSRRQGFGFDQDNFLGFSPQCNQWEDSWGTFWARHRLQPQIIRLAEMLGTGDRLVTMAEKLLGRLDDYLGGVPGQSVLLHGDLWSGNAAADEKGNPVIFDPASYYGHHEAEFGMMRLFGGFSTVCEDAYREILPFSDGHEQRIVIYRLYHEMNHLLLFGGGYYRSCQASLSQLV